MYQYQPNVVTSFQKKKKPNVVTNRQILEPALLFGGSMPMAREPFLSEHFIWTHLLFETNLDTHDRTGREVVIRC
jgi:hypothetical protein